MSGKAVFASLALFAIGFAEPARADQRVIPVNLRAGALSSALQDLARQTGAELLYDRAMVRDLRTPALRGRLTAEAALRRLLGGSGLTIRRSRSGAWLIERQRAVVLPPPPELEAPEILVIGNRTQNFDIRRRQDDVQPYLVTTGEELVRAHRDNVEQYFRSRVTANTQRLSPALGQMGETNSQIDLRGFGPEGTLVLVDGRRMPGVPGLSLAFGQPDLNAIPLHAIERIETLTGTAGGIHGFGALGGVVNVVLRRDDRGLELHGIGGISTRGDVRRASLEARLGFTPDGGRTDVSLSVSRAWSEPLLEGQRGFALRARENLYRLSREDLITGFPQFNAVSVLGFDGSNLVFKPEFGGGTLNSTFTHLPLGLDGSQGALIEALTRNAGRLELGLTDSQARTGLGSNPSTFSLLANARHRFGGGIEAYFDALVLRNRGRHIDRVSDGTLILFPSDHQNPFDNLVVVTFPPPANDTGIRSRFASERYTAGLIAPLPYGWRATAEATFGRMNYRSGEALSTYYNGSILLDGSESPDFNPFGNWDAFQRAADAYRFHKYGGVSVSNLYQEQSLRLAGPLFQTPAGPATLTLLAERRRERVPPFATESGNDQFGPLTPFISPIAGRTSTTRSFYAELRAPLFREAGLFPLLRGLELQLAVRRDEQRVDFARDPMGPDPDDRVQARFAATAFTAGARLYPLPGLMLRGSFATGHQPPPLEMLVGSESHFWAYTLVDPKRGADFFTEGNDYFYRLVGSGSPALGTGRATTLSLGMVLHPFGDGGARLSLDYSRIRRSGDPYAPSESLVLAREDLWPERVTRAPLSDEDRALGFTGGRIVTIDARPFNGGGVRAESIDLRADWPFSFANGRLRLSGMATLQLRNIRFSPFDPPVERAGYRGGPLRWRANGGVDWTTGPTAIGANLQYFSRYRVLPDTSFQIIEEGLVQVQGSKFVRSQIYLDLYASRRFVIPGPGRNIEITAELGIVNLLDQMPPYEGDSLLLGLLFSPYGDPRQRRVELTLSTSF